MNSDNIHVDPHITQYTVYISDNYTGNSIVNVNVMETQFTFNVPENVHCPIYQVSAWNAGGEGELSETLQERSKLPIYTPYMEEYYFTCLFYFLVPQKVATGNVVTYITASQVLHILLQVS